MRSVSFREVLQHELHARCERNPRYSLRAFARALALDHASLSQLLRGRRRVTTRAIRRIGKALRLSPHEIERHCVEANDAALLRVVGTPLFRADSRRLASVLGITLDEVNVSLQRLLRLGALRMTAAGQWEVLDGQPRRAMADRRA
jgi:transcriptional regulator with XRE-family HTH domain